MLEGLDQINWGLYERTQPSLVPVWLCDLASDDSHAREVAYEKLERRIAYWSFYDTDLGNSEDFKAVLSNDLPVLVVPFLVELLTYETVQNKEFILGLLCGLAPCLEAAHVFARRPEDEGYRKRAQLIFDSISKGTEIYQTFLSAKTPLLKEHALARERASILLDFLGSTSDLDSDRYES